MLAGSKVQVRCSPIAPVLRVGFGGSYRFRLSALTQYRRESVAALLHAQYCL